MGVFTEKKVHLPGYVDVIHMDLLFIRFLMREHCESPEMSRNSIECQEIHFAIEFHGFHGICKQCNCILLQKINFDFTKNHSKHI